jgi:hypothetical protein
VNEARVRGNVWSVTAAVLVVVAVAGLAVVLTDPDTRTDSNIPYTLIVAILGGTAFFAGLALAERAWLFGTAVAVAALAGLWSVVFAIWIDAYVESAATGGLLSAGLLTLVTTAAFATRLLATTAIARRVAVGAGVLAVVAGVVTFEGDLSGDPFWRVGTTITSLWILVALLALSVPLLDRAFTRSAIWLAPCALLAAIAVIGLVALHLGEFAPQGYDIFFTFMAAVLTAAALLGGLLAIERGALLLGWTALAVAPPSLGLVAYGIWADTADQFLQIWAGAVTTAALLVALIARLFARGRALTRLAAAAGVLAGAAALVGIWDLWTENVEINLFQQAATALWIVAVLCCLLVPVLERYRSQDAAEATA